MPTPNFNFPTINQSDTANVPRDLNALATSLDTAFQQTEYQTATVVGSQIRVTKPSASNRIFIKLTATMNSGSPISISLDGGSTSKNLVDINTVNITSLEKGLLEVVAEANFFTLRNTGGISNAEKDILVSKIGNPATTSDTFDVIMDKLQDAKDTFGTKLSVSPDTPLQEMADDLVVGKQWASGTISAGANMVFPIYSGSGSTTLFSLTVTGLTFKPSIIIYYPVSPVLDSDRVNTYYGALGPFLDIVQLSQISGAVNNAAQVIGMKGNSGNAYVNDTGFRLPTRSNATHYWVAFE